MEEYIRRAQDAERQARIARTETERTALLRIADVWRGLAQQALAPRRPSDRAS